VSEREVHDAAAALVAAFGSGAVDDYFARFAPEATFVFHAEPARLECTAAYRQLWARWEREDGFRVLDCTSRNGAVTMVGEAAAVFAHDVDTRVSTHAGPERLHERETIVFARRDGRWLAVHEHLSVRPTG
jgi:ketosteroid isomerase-like protein